MIDPTLLLIIIVAAIAATVSAIAFVRRTKKALPSESPTQTLELKKSVLPQKQEQLAPAPEHRVAPPSPTKPQPAKPLPSGTATVIPLPVEKPLRELPSRFQEQKRFQYGLAQTRKGFVAKLLQLFQSAPKVTEDLREELEMVLFTADIGTKTAQKLINRVNETLDKQQIADKDAVWSVIRNTALEIVRIPASPLDYQPKIQPYVLLMIGVNGVGKTTTLGKLAAMHQAEGRRTLLVAGDTFRAAAGEQLEVWARRVGCEIHQGSPGSDPSSVIFEGVLRGKREGFDVVLCDTAGRLHTKKTLMDELAKVRRSCAKALQQGAENVEIQGPHDTFLVLDATIGQNALAQADMFKEAMDFTGLVLTKLDGTAKGGVVLGICDTLQIPVRFIGIGEGIDDLRPFDPELFCDALLAKEEIS